MSGFLGRFSAAHRLMRLNPWLAARDEDAVRVLAATGKESGDEATELRKAERRIGMAGAHAAEARHGDGMVAWNMWASEMLALRRIVSHKPGAQRLWALAAMTRLDFGASDARALDVSGFMFPGRVVANCLRFRSLHATAARFCGDVAMETALVTGDADFQAAQFDGEADFARSCFGGRAEWRKAVFAGPVSMNGTRFIRDAWFPGAVFHAPADMRSAEFQSDAGFGGVRFCSVADFSGARFDDNAGFEAASFEAAADFSGACFFGNTWFRQATFDAKADFARARFSVAAAFDGARFAEARSPAHSALEALRNGLGAG